MNCETTPRLVVGQFQVVRQLVIRASPRRPFQLVLLAALLFGSWFPPASAAEPNRVLELDGNGSYVELPPNIFNDLKEATVEAWVKWERFQNFSRVFEFGASWQSMSLFNHGVSSDLRFNLYPKRAKEDPTQLFSARANGVLRSNEWVHIAAVAGPGGMKLYLNGEVVALHTNEACLAAIKVEQRNLIGRGLSQNANDRDFRGQMDEFRVWNSRRTPEQIRVNMHRRLTGREEGLVGLWNFDNGLATDVSARAHPGKLVGNARVVTPDFPAGLQLIAAELAPPAAAVAPAAAPVAVPPAPAPAPDHNLLYLWIAGALTLIVALLAWLGFTLKRNARSTPPVQPAQSIPALAGDKPARLEAAASPDLKERALAELTEFAKQSLVQGLYSQRNALLETQQQAQRELAELEARLLALKIPDRILAYEKRILELERDLESRAGELRELTNATLALLRRKVAEERELDRATRRFN